MRTPTFKCRVHTYRNNGVAPKTYLDYLKNSDYCDRTKKYYTKYFKGLRGISNLARFKAKMK